MPNQPKERVVDINGSAGAYVDIAVTCPCRLMEIMEINAAGAAYVAQGLQYKKAEDSYTAIFQLIPGDVLVLGNKLAHGHGAGGVIGFPARTNPDGAAIAAAIPVKLISGSVTATKVIVREYA